MNVLVLITGVGRSGTSTMSGTLHHLGLFVPGPYLGANESNPKGFFESKWSLEFHKRIAGAAGIADFDGRPEALELFREAITPADRGTLTAFLAEQAAIDSQVVVKDPRSVWAQKLWRDAAADAGMEIRYVSMLRHPAEVVGSRTTYYASKADEDKRQAYATTTIARWVNNSLVSERETRAERRSFVGYAELLEDWRPVVTRLADELGLVYGSEVRAGVPSPVDDFIDPGLRRHQVTWDDLETPRDLQDAAQEVWDHLAVIAASGGSDPDSSAALDRLAERYDRILRDAQAIAHDSIEGIRVAARRAGAREERERARRRPAAPKTPSGDDRRIRDVGGRELLRIAGRRFTHRFGNR
ncbi:sulfotransferase family protein [Nocardioides guangzhouensis]|uniref:sulfotransferase family protein n=1 Tax=Nocardioides guangzhouensis TaxID=2497878 RepID=UPI00106F753C|nr:sulfotransferase [Nocardioides guangzhouensis]